MNRRKSGPQRSVCLTEEPIEIMSRPLRLFFRFLIVAALAYGVVRLFAWLPPKISVWLVLMVVFGGVALLSRYRSRIRREARAAYEKEQWVAARATIRAVRFTNVSAPAGRIGVHLQVTVEDPAAGSKWNTLIDTDVPAESVGHFGTNTPLQVRYSPESKYVAELDGEIRLDR